MKQLTIHAPDRKFHFVIELLSNFSFVKIDKPAKTFIITEEQKRFVMRNIGKWKRTQIMDQAGMR